MATYTMTLQEILDSDPTYDFGLANYPIFDEAYRATLNQKIVDEYRNREIGAETPSEFRLWMRRKMNKIMPYYNQMYLSEKLKIDPLNTVNMSTIADSVADSAASGTMDGTSSSTGNSSQETTADSKARTVDMVTPQNELAGNGDYATGAQDSISNTTGGSEASNSENSQNSTETDTTAKTSTHTENVTKGYSGSQAALLNEFRKTFLNIDEEIIDDLATLFMQVYGTGSDILNTRKTGYGYGYFNGVW